MTDADCNTYASNSDNSDISSKTYFFNSDLSSSSNLPHGYGTSLNGTGCVMCEPISDAESITCNGPNNSRAVCNPGFYKVDNEASFISDQCLPCTPIQQLDTSYGNQIVCTDQSDSQLNDSIAKIGGRS